eukprot:TRINITY_DN1703_c0_g1_i2.p2 TRINITY_DN1703_c0_g1~~TRINITY_DN1703_c0_g1_i2.p2  ORF type:complete len:269 (+),score=-15.29 TRINITY_DN1703_c0_g1_i2:156-962(+)
MQSYATAIKQSDDETITQTIQTKINQLQQQFKCLNYPSEEALYSQICTEKKISSPFNYKTFLDLRNNPRSKHLVQKENQALIARMKSHQILPIKQRDLKDAVDDKNTWLLDNEIGKLCAAGRSLEAYQQLKTKNDATVDMFVTIISQFGKEKRSLHLVETLLLMKRKELDAKLDVCHKADVALACVRCRLRVGDWKIDLENNQNGYLLHRLMGIFACANSYKSVEKAIKAFQKEWKQVIWLDAERIANFDLLHVAITNVNRFWWQRNV